MEQITCPCGNPYTPVSDEDAVGVPPSYIARQFYCSVCKTADWVEPHDLGVFSWEEVLGDDPSPEDDDIVEMQL